MGANWGGKLGWGEVWVGDELLLARAEVGQNPRVESQTLRRKNLHKESKKRNKNDFLTKNSFSFENFI